MPNITLAIKRFKGIDETFTFVRDLYGAGCWVSATENGRQPPNMIVPVEVGAALTKIAISSALEELHNFARTAPAPAKVTSVRVKKERVSSAKAPAGMIGGFNPFKL